MTTDRETAEVVRSWMKEETELNDAGLHRVIARLPDTPQRRHRWLWPFARRPFGSGATRSADSHGAIPTGRFLHMFTATRVAAITAVLALGGMLAIVSGPLAPQGDPVGAPATDAPAASVSQAPVHFSGTTMFHYPDGGETTVLADRVEIRGVPFPFSIIVDDARISTMFATSAGDWDDFPTESGDVLHVLRRGEGRIENDDGAWGLTLVSVWSDPSTSDEFVYMSMVGEGGYDGLVGHIVLTDPDRNFMWQTKGWIFPEERLASE